MAYTVSEAATLAHVSVRTLHHYDEIGLVRPARRSQAGYRLYERCDLERLQQALLFRELGFTLEEIREALDDPGFDRAEALLMQRELLAEKTAHLDSMIASIDKAIDASQKGIAMDAKDMFEVFGDEDPTQYEDEARERWGDTDAYKESARRTKRYTKQDWQRFKDEAEAIGLATAALMDEGVAPDDTRATDLAEQARLQIDTWFYPCSHQMHAKLAEMYLADPRFTATYEKIHAGMARYWHDAILANAAAHADGRG
jgi:MerR family transcriptional regulator, thiopeptide resistance regulator